MKNTCSTLYTKEVMGHFKKPHNYGKIKDADGIGKVGNIVCLTPHQNIHINSDLEKIDRISKENRVLSHDGKYNFILNGGKRNYSGQILTIKNKLGEISITPEHLLNAIKIPNGDKFLRTQNRKKLIPAWYHADQLKKGDIALYPVLREEKDIKYLEIDIEKSKHDFRSRAVPTKIPVNADLLRLFGYFLSEGNIQDKPCRTFISFTLNIKEKDIVEDIRNIVKNLFGLDITVRERKEVKTVVVYIYNSKLARFFKELFGNGAKNKKIPDLVMSLPVRKQKSIIYGLWRGDGYVNIERDGARAGYVTISEKIIHQLKTLLLRQQIVPSLYTEEEKIVNGAKHQKCFRIHVGQRNSLVNLCSILGIKYIPKSYISEKSWFDNNYLYIPITKIKREKYKGFVYNIEVDKSHSFTSEAFCLHNCGDVMWLYIKVKNDVIKEIKFETFGCVAAISTSSVITDLAKGKTIEEALKIEKSDVIKSLGGLPSIKYHCSVLAVDALIEAIYDYLSKSKKPISKSLELKHQKIRKDKEIIEKRYKKWL